MGVIRWFGESEHWQVPVCAEGPRFAMALTERWGLDVARSDLAARKLSLQAGLNCTSRLALRVALASTSLNPRWTPWEWNGAMAVKAPASAANLGVRFLHSNEYIEYLQAAAPDLARFGVLEEYVDGPQYEVDGYVIGETIRCFHPLLQHWNEAGEAIVGYERKVPPGTEWRDGVLSAVRAVGLQDAPFCVEARYDVRRQQWKIIDIHARLGEDQGLGALMWDEDPILEIEKTCRRATPRPPEWPPA